MASRLRTKIDASKSSWAPASKLVAASVHRSRRSFARTSLARPVAVASLRRNASKADGGKGGRAEGGMGFMD